MTSSIPKIVRTDRIPHEDIDPDALKVIGRLRRFGHEAYLVGGCVRDLLLGAHPKDFDVITSARPRQVRRIFSNSRVIGRRFRLVHVIFGQNIIEVSTFRADPGEFAEKAKLEAEAAQAAASEESAPPPASAEAGAPPVESATDLPETGPDSPAPEAAEPDSPAPAALTPIEAAAQLSPEESEPVDAPDEPEALSPPEEDEEAELDEDDEEEEPVSPDPLPAGGGRAPAEPPSELRSREPSREEDEDDESTWDRRRGRRRRPRPEFDGNNIFGTPEEDARRRDFTINAIFYDPEHRELVDYVSGLEDIERGLINPINDPLRSLAEDPVRIIRAVRFAAKLGFKIEDTALRAIEEKRKLIAECSQRRLLEEIFKILKGGHASASFRLMEDLGILEFLLPEIADWLAKAPSVPRLASPAADTVPVPDSAPVTDTVPVTDTATDTVPVIDTVSVSAPVTAAAPLPEAAPVTEMVAPPPAEAPAPEPAEIKLGPIPAWEPPTRAIEAYLRVTWEHPPKEGPNDWVEDPHEEVVDAIFEAAAFARDVVLERFGFRSLAGEASERQRARAVMKVLQLNGRLTDAIAWVEEQGRPPPGALLERSERRGRNGRWRDRRRRRAGMRRSSEEAPRREPGAPPAVERSPREGALPASGPSPSTANRRPPLDRQETLFRYLEGLDKLMSEGVPLETGAQLAALYAPMLKDALDETLGRGRGRDPETVIDDIIYPIAQRHSLARRDRDRVKRITLAMRRLLRDADGRQGGRRRRSRGAHRILGKDYFQEALVLLWVHARATGEGWEAFRHWQQQALDERRTGRREGHRGNGDFSREDGDDFAEDDDFEEE